MVCRSQWPGLGRSYAALGSEEQKGSGLGASPVRSPLVPEAGRVRAGLSHLERMLSEPCTGCLPSYLI